jgi:hypothetical protein
MVLENVDLIHVLVEKDCSLPVLVHHVKSTQDSQVIEEHAFQLVKIMKRY